MNPVPAIVTYAVVVANTSQFPANGIQVNHTLAITDKASTIVAEPVAVVTIVVCSFGNMAAGAVTGIDVVVQIQQAQIDLSSCVTA